MTHAQSLWLMVSIQMGIFSAIWFLAARTQIGLQPALLHMGWFNLFLSLGLGLVFMRGHGPELLTRTGAQLCALLACLGMARSSAALRPQPRPLGRTALRLLGFSAFAIIALGLYQPQGQPQILVLCASMLYLSLQVCLNLPDSIEGAGFTTPGWILRLPVWSFMASLLILGIGGALNAWSLSLETDTRSNLVLAYALIASFSGVNAATAYAVVHRLTSDLEDLLSHDHLTGLLNRRAIGSAHDNAWAQWRRQQRPYTALCIDIDHFKAVNDNHGHATGDQVLIAVAETLKAQLRSIDALGRTGGEEFLALLDSQESDPIRVAERLRQSVAELRLEALGSRPLSISVGVAWPEPQDRHPEHVLQRADQALYAAKHRGRNRVEMLSGSQSQPAFVKAS